MGAGQPQGLQGSGQGSQGAMALQAGDSTGPWRTFQEQRQGPQQPPQPGPVPSQLAGSGVAERQYEHLGGRVTADRQAPGQVSGKSPGCLATAHV